MSPILAIDPGNEQSAVLTWDGSKVSDPAKIDNSEVMDRLANYTPSCREELVIEMVACYGMPVGREVFDTCVWIGRFDELWRLKTFRPPRLIYRGDVKLHHCHSARAKDSNIRQALIDRFGKPGTKKNPGVTYGLSGDMWQAFALAVYAYDQPQRSAE